MTKTGKFTRRIQIFKRKMVNLHCCVKKQGGGGGGGKESSPMIASGVFLH